MSEHISDVQRLVLFLRDFFSDQQLLDRWKELWKGLVICHDDQPPESFFWEELWFSTHGTMLSLVVTACIFRQLLADETDLGGWSASLSHHALEYPLFATEREMNPFLFWFPLCCLTPALWLMVYQMGTGWRASCPRLVTCGKWFDFRKMLMIITAVLLRGLTHYVQKGGHFKNLMLFKT